MPLTINGKVYDVVAIIDPSTSQPISNFGAPALGTAVDASGSQPSIGGTPLASQPASTRLGYWFCQNQSAAILTVVLDDGNGANLSVFVLASGAGAGQQGGSMGWQDTGPHAGRIRVYGASGAQFALRVQ